MVGRLLALSMGRLSRDGGSLEGGRLLPEAARSVYICTLIDNATLSDFQIKKVAYAFTTNPEKAWHILNSDYKTDISKSMDEETILKFEGQIESE